MYTLLKKIIPEAPRKYLREVRDKAYLFCNQANKFVINNTLTDKMKIDFKSSVEVIRKLDYDKAEILLNIDSEIEYITRLHSCKKEPEMIKWIENSFSKGDVFYDVGANVGAYTLVAAKYFKGDVKVYAFEPSCLNFVQLSKNIFINKCHGCVTPMQIALSETTMLGTFNYSNLIPGGALHSFGESVDYKGDHFVPVYQQEIFSYRLDDLIQKFNLPIPNHIKLDVDGIEFNILKGAERTLQSSKLKSIFVELDEGDDEAKEVIKFLGRFGFKYGSKHKYTSEEDTGPFSKMFNYIFVKN